MPEILIDLFTVGHDALNSIAYDSNVASTLLQHVLEVAVEINDPELAKRLTLNGAVSDTTARAALEFIGANPAYTAHAVRDPRCPPGIVMGVLGGEADHGGSLGAALQHPDISADMLDVYAESENDELRMRVAEHQNTRAATLAVLGCDANVDVRASAFANTHCPYNVIESAAQGAALDGWPDHDLYVIAKASHASNAALRAVGIRHVQLGREVVKNSAADARTLRVVTSTFIRGDHGWFDTDSYREIVAHSNCPPDLILTVLGLTTDSRTSHNVLRRTDVRSDAVSLIAAHRGESFTVIEALAHPLCNEEILIAAAQSDYTGRRAAVASNPSTPGGILDTLSADTATKVRGAVAGNPATPAPTLLALVRRSVSSVQRAAMRNPRTPALFNIDPAVWAAHLADEVLTAREIVAIAA